MPGTLPEPAIPIAGPEPAGDGSQQLVPSPEGEALLAARSQQIALAAARESASSFHGQLIRNELEYLTGLQEKVLPEVRRPMPGASSSSGNGRPFQWHLDLPPQDPDPVPLPAFEPGNDGDTAMPLSDSGQTTDPLPLQNEVLPATSSITSWNAVLTHILSMRPLRQRGARHIGLEDGGVVA